MQSKCISLLGSGFVWGGKNAGICMKLHVDSYVGVRVRALAPLLVQSKLTLAVLLLVNYTYHR